jgi:Ni/Fe-hydrogenase subunit HybB-like protein
LFGQCEGRDFWQTSLLLPTLLAQAGACGSAVALLAAPVFDVSDFLHRALTWLLLGSVAATAGLVAVELTTKGTVHVETAKWTMTHGTYRTRFWGSIIIGLAFAGALAGSALLLDQRFLASVAGVAALVGVALYEDAFVRAGQSVPLC